MPAAFEVPDKPQRDRKARHDAFEDDAQGAVEHRHAEKGADPVPYGHKNEESRHHQGGSALLARRDRSRHCQRRPEKYINILKDIHYLHLLSEGNEMKEAADAVLRSNRRGMDRGFLIIIQPERASVNVMCG